MLCLQRQQFALGPKPYTGSFYASLTDAALLGNNTASGPAPVAGMVWLQIVLNLLSYKLVFVCTITMQRLCK